jgi:lipopolysaccharide transport system ATP-binding protein
MSSDPIIDARGLGKAYPIYRRSEDRLKQLLWGRWRRYFVEYWAVRDVDLSVGRGETVGIIGRNGSGKSTLLQMICGTLRPSSGEVNVRGRVAAMLELGSGFNPEFTGRENVRLAGSVLGLSREEIEARFDAIADFAGIGVFMDQPIKRYSSGMHARLAFAVCANVDADVLVVDEVLSVGDAAFQQKCMRFLNRFRMHGTLLFVSHDSGAITKLCDRALWLEQGLVRGLGDAKEMCRLYLAAQAEESGGDKSKFNLGGRGNVLRPTSNDSVLEPEPSSAVCSTGHVNEELLFDTDEVGEFAGAAEIESAGFFTADGDRLHIASGGEAVELRVRCRALRQIHHAALAFVVRDRLGQIIFSDDTLGNPGEPQLDIGTGQVVTVRFALLLPYFASGPYAIEAFLFERRNGGFELIQHRTDKEFLYVQSVHISNGLANIAMRSVTLEVTSGTQFSNPADTTPFAAEKAG